MDARCFLWVGLYALINALLSPHLLTNGVICALLWVIPGLEDNSGNMFEKQTVCFWFIIFFLFICCFGFMLSGKTGHQPSPFGSSSSTIIGFWDISFVVSFKICQIEPLELNFLKKRTFYLNVIRITVTRLQIECSVFGVFGCFFSPQKYKLAASAAMLTGPKQT